MSGRLILAPVGLSATPWPHFLPAEAQAVIAGLQHFVVETPKAARAHLKHLEHPTALRDLSIEALPKSPTQAQLDRLLEAALKGHDMGLLSDAGCPAVADPGAALVERAHALGITVVPLVGPSSILLALMGSGLNGQSFAFNGYLPVAEEARDRSIKTLESESRKLGRTQIFIETPYRNERMFDALLKCCQPTTRICIARELTGPQQWIATHTVAEWSRAERPELDRRPSLFLLLAA